LEAFISGAERLAARWAWGSRVARCSIVGVCGTTVWHAVDVCVASDNCMQQVWVHARVQECSWLTVQVLAWRRVLVGWAACCVVRLFLLAWRALLVGGGAACGRLRHWCVGRGAAVSRLVGVFVDFGGR
jgi:hypothetical protein